MDFPSSNTGPKGVLNDYKIAKAREQERFKERAKADHEHVQSSTLTTTSVAEDERRKMADKIGDMDDDELDALGTILAPYFWATLPTIRSPRALKRS